MPYRNLDEYLIRLEQAHELIQIKSPANTDGDITKLTRDKLRLNKALWFDNVAGSKFPVVTNIFGTSNRMAWALGLDNLDTLTSRLTNLLSLDMPQGLSGIMGRAGEMLGVLRNITPTKQTTCQHCVQDVVITEDIDLGYLPVLRNHPQDSHRSITLGQLLTQDMTTGNQRVAVIQAHVIDQHTLAIPVSALPLPVDKTPIPTALVIGGDPAEMWCGLASLPANVSPYFLAGWLRNRPVSLLPAITQPVNIPYDAEFVLEGWIDPTNVHDDIVFADETGKYIPKIPHLTLHITAITHRHDAVYPAFIPAFGEHYWLHKAFERLSRPILRLLLEGVIDIHLPLEGVFRNLAIVSIDNRYHGHAQKVLHGMWGLGDLALIKTIIVVDDDIDIYNIEEVATRVLETVDWNTDVTLVYGVLHAHDDAYGLKAGIDATRTNKPVLPAFSPLDGVKLNQSIGERWMIPIHGVIIVQQSDSMNNTLEQIWAIQPDYHVIVTDFNPKTQDLSTITIRVLANLNWANSIIHNPSEDYTTIAIDGTSSPETQWIEPVINQGKVID